VKSDYQPTIGRTPELAIGESLVLKRRGSSMEQTGKCGDTPNYL
jgi:hypothetical protein